MTGVGERSSWTTSEREALLALASIASFGPRRLWSVVLGGAPLASLDRVLAGRPAPEIAGTADQHRVWQREAQQLDPAGLAELHRVAGVRITVFGDVGHPATEPGDPHLPALLFWRGAASWGDLTHRPLVGVIGTRRATRYGFDLARDFAEQLTAKGCCVVSGLASGIDAAAHRGAVDVRIRRSSLDSGVPLAVVGSGLDRPYPRSNARLWEEVAEHGLIASEYPMGTAPVAWHFPARNRVLAALCDLVLVVESHERGGALITAGIAAERGVPVMAVPGAIHNSASSGSNRLIADGCAPCLSIDDLVVALALQGEHGTPTLPFGESQRLDPAEAAVLDALGFAPATLSELAAVLPTLGFAEVSVALATLAQRSLLSCEDGTYQRRLP